MSMMVDVNESQLMCAYYSEMQQRRCFCNNNAFLPA